MTNKQYGVLYREATVDCDAEKGMVLGHHDSWNIFEAPDYPALKRKVADWARETNRKGAIIEVVFPEMIATILPHVDNNQGVMEEFTKYQNV